MLLLILLLLLAGLLLLLLESVFPGGLVGTAGALGIGLSVYLCIEHYGWKIGLVYLAFSSLLALAVGISSFLYAMRRLALDPPASPAGPAASETIGRTGRVVLPLDPTGYIEIDGVRHQARCEFSQTEIPVGEEVVVTGRDSGFLLVRPPASPAPEGPAVP